MYILWCTYYLPLTDHALISNIDDDDVKNVESKFGNTDNDNNVDLQTKWDCWLIILWELSFELFNKLRKHTIVQYTTKINPQIKFGVDKVIIVRLSYELLHH